MTPQVSQIPVSYGSESDCTHVAAFLHEAPALIRFYWTLSNPMGSSRRIMSLLVAFVGIIQLGWISIPLGWCLLSFPTVYLIIPVLHSITWVASSSSQMCMHSGRSLTLTLMPVTWPPWIKPSVLYIQLRLELAPWCSSSASVILNILCFCSLRIQQFLLIFHLFQKQSQTPEFLASNPPGWSSVISLRMQLAWKWVQFI